MRAPTWSVSRSWRARASRVGGAAPRRTRCSRSPRPCRARSAQRARARRMSWPHQKSDEQRDRARWKCSSASAPRAAGATAADRQIAGRAARRPSALRAARERARMALAIDVLRRRGRARRRAAAPRGGARPAPPRPTGGSPDARRAGADGRRTEGGASARGRRARLAECRSRPPRIGARDGAPLQRAGEEASGSSGRRRLSAQRCSGDDNDDALPACGLQRKEWPRARARCGGARPRAREAGAGAASVGAFCRSVSGVAAKRARAAAGRRDGAPGRSSSGSGVVDTGQQVEEAKRRSPFAADRSPCAVRCAGIVSFVLDS